MTRSDKIFTGYWFLCMIAMNAATWHQNISWAGRLCLGLSSWIIVPGFLFAKLEAFLGVST